MTEREKDKNGYTTVAIEDLLSDPGQFVHFYEDYGELGDLIKTQGFYEPRRRYSRIGETGYQYDGFGASNFTIPVVAEEGVLTAEDTNAGSLTVEYVIYSGLPYFSADEKEEMQRLLMNQPPLGQRRKVATRGRVEREASGEYYLKATRLAPIDKSE